MRKVYFDGILTQNDGLIYQSHHFDFPEPHTSFVRIPYRSGDIDLTESISKTPVYSNYEGVINLCTIKEFNDVKFVEKSIKFLIGKKVKVRFDDEEFERIGRIVSIEKDEDPTKIIYSLNFNFEPFMKKTELTVLEEFGITNHIFNIVNFGKIFNLEITANQKITVNIENHSFVFEAGTNFIPYEIPFGATEIEIDAVALANVKLEYVEGIL